MITPVEIRQQVFRKTMRGYDKEEVRAFLIALSKEWESHLKSFKEAKEELDQLRASYKALKEVEEMLHKTLMQAERSSRDTLETARQKAELKLQEAEAQAHEIRRRALKNRDELQQEVQVLSRQRESVITELRVFLKTQLEHLDAIRPIELPAQGQSSANGQYNVQAEKSHESSPPNTNGVDPATAAKNSGNLFDEILGDM